MVDFQLPQSSWSQKISAINSQNSSCMKWNAPFSLANTEPHSISEWMYTTNTTQQVGKWWHTMQ